MQQPIIDPEKVNAWTQSMRGAFSGGPGNIGTWLVVGITVAVLLVVVFTAWRSSRHTADPNKDLQFLIDAKPGPKSLDATSPIGDVHVGHGARTNHMHDELARAARRRSSFTPR